MAPVSKKAKTAAKPTPGGGLNKFFGAAKGGDPAAAAAAAPAPPAKVEVPAVAPPASQPVAPVSGGGLTDAQKQRIEENRRRAMERQQAKQNGGKTTPEDVQKSPSPLKPLDENNLKRKGAEITPEKVPMPAAANKAPAVQESSSAPCGDGRFSTFAKVPWMQYNNLYAARLDKLRGAVMNQARSLWSNEVPATNFLTTIATNPADTVSEIVMVGVTFKEMTSRSKVIEQYRDPNVATSTLPEDDVDEQPNLCSDADTAWLEDATFRIELQLSVEEIAKLATGFVAAVRGKMSSDGKGRFQVKAICFAQGLASIPLPATEVSSGPYLALLSGLSIGAPDEDVEARNLVVDFLLGNSEAESEKLLGQAVKHVIVCGDVYSMGKAKELPAGLQDADNMFALLAEKLPVEVMPGHKDPTNLSLPQMPLHPYMFRSASKCSQFKCLSNPYSASVGDLQILGHSGQPVRDLMRCTSIPTQMEALTTCLDGGLLAPTAPDTLITQSFDKADPFVIETKPQLLFSGGHSKAEYEWREPSDGGAGTLCVGVPAFHKHPAVVLVNMSNPRDIRVHEFGTCRA